MKALNSQETAEGLVKQDLLFSLAKAHSLLDQLDVDVKVLKKIKDEDEERKVRHTV